MAGFLLLNVQPDMLDDTVFYPEFERVFSMTRFPV